MNSHKNAGTTPYSRALIAERPFDRIGGRGHRDSAPLDRGGSFRRMEARNLSFTPGPELMGRTLNQERA